MTDKTATDRTCPGCGKVHASSIVPAGEVRVYGDPPVEAESYRVFVCGGRFYVKAEGSS